ncbi:MAG TPA: hypothetical protein VFV73_00615 [Streptosporangiaceae bacterium]|nr:hypothetical protein [Streptosporangiaceae bacterium]
MPTYLQFVHQVDYALRLGFLREGPEADGGPPEEAGRLGEAAAAGVDEVGMKALFTAALRNFDDGGGAARLPGRDGRGAREGGVDRGARRDGGAA